LNRDAFSSNRPLREAIVLRPPRNRVAVTLELGRDLVLRDTLERQDERLLALRASTMGPTATRRRTSTVTSTSIHRKVARETLHPRRRPEHRRVGGGAAPYHEPG